MLEATEPAVTVLRTSAGVLSITRSADRGTSRSELAAALAELHSVAHGRYREDIVAVLIGSAQAAFTRYLHAAVYRVTRGASEAVDDNVTALGHDATAAWRTLDDAVRQYLSESGGATDSRAPIVRASNRVTQMRSAADLIADISSPPPVTAYSRAKAVIEAHSDALCTGDPALPPISDDLVPALRAESTGDEAAITAALPLVAATANVGELELVSPSTPDEALAHSAG